MVDVNHDVIQIFSCEEIVQRITELSARIIQDYSRKGSPLCVVGVFKGAGIFVSDLVRAIGSWLPIDLHYLHSSPGDEPEIPSSIAEKHVLLVVNLISTGQTLDTIVNACYEQKPRSVKVCVLVDKLQAHCIRVPEVRYIGFEVKEGWVVGYGLDQHDAFRHLPYLGIVPIAQVGTDQPQRNVSQSSGVVADPNGSS